jgi:hypothetical protein
MVSTGDFLSNSKIKDQRLDKNTLFSSFGKWVAPINSVKFQERVDELNQDKYKKKLTTKR